MLFLQGQDGSGHESWLYAGKIPMGTSLLLVDPYLKWTWSCAWLLLTCTFCLLRLKLHLSLPNSSPIFISQAPDSESVLGTQSGLGIVIWKISDYLSAMRRWCVLSCSWEWAISLLIQMAGKVLILSASLSPWDILGASQTVPRPENVQTIAQICTFLYCRKCCLACRFQCNFPSKIHSTKQLFLGNNTEVSQELRWMNYIRLIPTVFQVLNISVIVLGLGPQNVFYNFASQTLMCIQTWQFC